MLRTTSTTHRIDGLRMLDDVPASIAVVSVPATHPYVDAVTSSPSIRRYRPEETLAGPAVWRPSVVLDPTWIRDHAADVDVLHIHFGTESFSVAHLEACIDAAHRVGWSVVFTVHDLEHPQVADQSLYRAQLDVLVPGADAVVTLTEGAAAEIRRRWGRSALVSPHPSILAARSAPHVLSSEQFHVGMHLKDLRPNVDGPRMVDALVAAVNQLAHGGADVLAEVRMHRDVRDTEARDAIREIAAGSDRVIVIEHDRLDDQELANVLSRMDACILPYRHGTHSGWLELCWDLAVPVIAPRVGFYAEQHTDGSVTSFEPDRDGRSLADGIRRVMNGELTTRAGSVDREAQIDLRRLRREDDDAAARLLHASLYRRLVSERAA